MNAASLRAANMKKSLQEQEKIPPTTPTNPSQGHEKSKGKRPRNEGGDSLPPSACLARKWTDWAPMMHDMIKQLYSQTDDDAYVNEACRDEVDAMYDAFAKFGVAMTVVVERFKFSLQEASGLRVELNQVRNECYQLKENLRRMQSELKLTSIGHEKDIELKEIQITNLKDRLKSAISSKNNLQRKLEATEQELVEARDQVSTFARRNTLSQEEAIEAWKQTQACEDYKNEIGVQSFECGVNDAVDKIRRAFSETGLEDSWPLVKGKYDELVGEANQMAMQTGSLTEGSSSSST